MLEDLTINGATATILLSAAAHLDASLTYSRTQVTNLVLTAIDQPSYAATRALMDHMDEGADSTIGELTLRPESFSTGGTAEAPIVTVGFKSRAVTELEKRTGGHSWGNTDVSAWAKAEIRAVGADPFVQHGLGERDIERKAPEGDHEKPESSWDVMAEMAKQVGAWLYDTGQEVVLARPSWLVAKPSNPRYELEWNSWTDHSDALVAAPEYRVNYAARPWEGREEVVFTVADTSDHGPAHDARPGHTIRYTGDAAPLDPVWIVTEVTVPSHHDEPVTITAWRPVDPPQIVDEKGGGEGVAGVPTGPIGQGGWAGEQLKNAAEIVREGQGRNLPRLAYELAVACAMGESSLRNIGYGDAAGPDSCGLFQQRDTWGSRSDRLTPSKAAGFYYTALVATDYKTTAANGGASVVYGGYYGGTPAANASLTIHNVQRNADPAHYVRFWDDARLVVKACIEAGRAGVGGKLSGDLGKKVDDIFASISGKYWDLDGSWGNQCTDGASKFIQELTGIPMISANGEGYWRHPSLMGRFAPIPAGQNPVRGDVVSWSGTTGAYTNGGYGHVAIYSHSERGQHYFLSQNPTPLVVQPLSMSGVRGFMRVMRSAEEADRTPSGM